MTTLLVPDASPAASQHRVCVKAHGAASYVHVGRLAAVLSPYDVEQFTYRRHPTLDRVDIYVQALVVDEMSGARLERRVRRCIGILEVTRVEPVDDRDVFA